MSKIKGILDEELQEGETEQAFLRHSFGGAPISGKPSKEMVEALAKGAAKKQKETLPVPASPPSNVLDFWYRKEAMRIYEEWEGQNLTTWFCLADICKILGYKDADQARKAHCLGKTLKQKPEGSTVQLVYVRESDLYNLILRSNSPSAIPFRKFVTEKVLPVLRQLKRINLVENPSEYIEQKVKEAALSSQGVQLELFPITAKPSLTFQPAAVDALAAARKKLLESNTTFSSYSDFLGYLIKKGLEQIGVAGFELSGEAP